MKKKLRKIGKAFLYTVFSLVFAWTIFFFVGRLANPTEYPMLFGYSEAHIISGSMEPTLSQGDHVVFRKQGSYALEDVVVYYDEADGVFVVHRIVGMNGDKFIMQGDCNPECDSAPVSPESIQGKVVLAIPNLQSFLLIGYGSIVTLLIQKLIRDIKAANKERTEKGGEQNDEKQDIKNI